MARWSLSEKNLTEGYDVVNRFPSIFRDYSKHVFVAFFFLFAQSALIFRLFVLGRIRRKAEKELRGTCRALEEKQEELGRAKELQERAFESLRESEVTLQSILSSIPTGVFVIDAGTRTVRMANKAAAELLGKEFKKMPGSLCPECFAPFIGEEVRESAPGWADLV